ncbi:MAG: MoaD/ThiS family protein [Burkholderiaceae bacterium]|nr:MoaD/ThiS family protein [Burkholderiaceae bacterium]
MRCALETSFGLHPRLRGHVGYDQGQLRAKFVIVVDGRRSGDRVALADRLSVHSRVHVLQPLSRG